MARRVTGTGNETVKTIGESLIFLGMGGLAVMSIAGYVALIALLMSGPNGSSSHSNSNNHCCHHGDGFWTGFFVASIFSSGNSRNYGHTHSNEMMDLVVFSAVVSVIAIAVAFAYGFPVIGFAIGIGWAVSVLTVALGALVYHVGESMESSAPAYSI